MKFVIGPDQVYLSFYGRFHIEILQKIDIPTKGIVTVPRIFRSNCCKLRKISLPPMHFLFQTAVSYGGSQLIFITPMHVEFQTAVSSGENQLISNPPLHALFQTAVKSGGSQ
jgi:hypothetical protein